MKLAGAVLLTTCVLLLGASAVHAQEPPDDPQSMAIWLTAPDEEIEFVEPLTAYVDGVACGTQRIEKGVPVVPVGETGTPDVCRSEGATVTLVTDNGLELFAQPQFAAGTSYPLENLVPGPPHTGAPPADGSAPGPAAAGHGILDASTDAGRAASTAALGTLTLALLAAARFSTGRHREQTRGR